MIWSEFKTAVEERLGIDMLNPNPELSAQIANATLDGALHLQRRVAGLREGHQTVYTPADGKRVFPQGMQFELPSGIHKVDEFYYRETYKPDADEEDPCESWPAGFELTGFADLADLNGSYYRTGISDPLEKIDELGYGPKWFVNESDETYSVRVVKKDDGLYYPAFFEDSDPVADGELYYLGNPLREDGDEGKAYSPWLPVPQPDAMVVEGSGEAAINDLVYVKDGSNYVSGNIGINAFGTSYWEINNNGVPLYYSDDFSSPDETTWIQDTGSLPLPTIRPATWADIDAAGIDRSTVPVLGWKSPSDDSEVSMNKLIESRIYFRQPHRLDFVPWREIEKHGTSLAWSSVRPGYSPFVVRGPFPSRFDRVELHWTGIKRDFADGDETPFTAECAYAVAHFVKAETNLGHKEKRLHAREHRVLFKEMVRDLYLEYKDRGDSMR